MYMAVSWISGKDWIYKCADIYIYTYTFEADIDHISYVKSSPDWGGFQGNKNS